MIAMLVKQKQRLNSRASIGCFARHGGASVSRNAQGARIQRALLVPVRPFPNIKNNFF